MAHTQCTCFPPFILTSLKALTIIWVTWFVNYIQPKERQKPFMYIQIRLLMCTETFLNLKQNRIS